jgi:folate-binding protein YgfZ
LPAGRPAEALLLDPAGHIEHALHVIDDGETTWLLVEHADTDAVLDFLQKMRFMLRVEPADRTADFATVGSIGEPDALTSLAATSNGIRLAWRDPWPSVVEGGHQYARQGRPQAAAPGAASDAASAHPGSSYRWVETLVPRDSLGALAAEAASGALSVAGTLAAEALRVAAWRPRLAAEVDERSIPHELDWLRTAVHLEKGCYRGQETVAKVHNLGHPPRRLVFLHLDGSEGIQVPAGAEVLAGDAVAGRVTSSAVHHELGPVALAVVKRSTDPSADLVVRTQDGLVAGTVL